MRCANCVRLGDDDFLMSGVVCFCESFAVLKASADAGCDLCALFWTRCGQTYGETALGYLLQGLTHKGEVVVDSSVWLEGHSYQGAHDEPNKLWIHLGEPVFTGQQSRQMTELHVFADPGTPTARLFSGTWTTTSRNPELYLELARKWLSDCRRKHQSCSSPPFSQGEKDAMPTRLIDVGKPCDRNSARLVITDPSKIQAPYLALSYCWGVSTQASTILKDDNIHKLLVHIDEAELPKTYTDMFQLARDLEFRYVWVDALCIIQGNAEDWAYESQRMTLVYGNAALTIIAGRAADAREGFLENRLCHAAGPCDLPFCDKRHVPSLLECTGNMGNMGSIWLSLPRKYDRGPVSDRAWCLQEELLSPRALVFGTEQLRFKCQELEIYENGSTKSLINQSRNPHSVDTAGLISPGLSIGEAAREQYLRRQMLIYWYKEVLIWYTARKLSNQDDVFAALSGMAQIMKTKIRSRYLAGIWEADMVRGLLWRSFRTYNTSLPRRACERRTKITGSPQRGDKESSARVTPIRVPSWSWAAVHGHIIADFTDNTDRYYHKSTWQIRPAHPDCWATDPACHAATVHIPRCELEFFGRLRRVKCIPYQRPDKCIGPSKRRDAAHVHLTPIEEVETSDSAERKHDPRDSSHTVACAWFDVAEERVSTCWCLPLTSKKGLLLLRNDQGKYSRTGTMDVGDLAWMIAVEEEKICLI
ncbi:heterokaryon incompatibility protein-domain-containing protein [Nemania sp. FL0916]|nr:heterokaryon incompatibility protein-domain-containing protein [Nemania sp. FL0916]